MAQEKIEGWLTEVARLNAAMGLHNPVLQYCIRILEEFHIYLPLLTKLSSLQLHGLNFQVLLRGVFISRVRERRGREGKDTG